MRAFRLIEWQEPPRIEEVDVPEPGPGQVLLKVGGAGLCHSDLHLMDWEPGVMPFDPPFTLGHENAGWIESLGDGVAGFEIGQAVAVYGPWGCGRCRACRLSREDYCERQSEIGTFGGGLGLDGGMAEYMLVPSARLLVPLDDLDPRDVAPLTDAALTLPWGARIATTYWGTAVELMEVLELSRDGRIGIETERHSLDEAEAAYGRLREGKVKGRAVVCPNG
ncbi:MAG: alcohol dehydrogenase catalytic domain-containing protein [Actinomycetota bacterium]|nr:alcohol dehydrogenase catalytic domain-containing protein [Actinomycetota bacterium]